VAVNPDSIEGRVSRVAGPVVDAVGLVGVAMLDLVSVGEGRLPGEVIALDGDAATIQVYEYTGGLRPGEPVRSSGRPLMAELGPGLLGGIFDGMLRPLDGFGDFLDLDRPRATLDRSRTYPFTPRVAVGDVVAPGQAIGSVEERSAFAHRVVVPPDGGGRVESIATAGVYTVVEPLASVAGRELTAIHSWPVRRPAPFAERLFASERLATGQRVLDLFFPVARGGTVSVPGGFGTGKTVLLQQIAKWCDADVIVYVGCGERGNELADVLVELAQLDDPRGDGRLLDRTVLIANTSNMPVMAREASIYTGVTIAEHYRDIGHDVVVIADSTSRWAEALREVASRTDQLPAEEGYPATLPAALAAFYERAGRVRTLGGDDASVTIIGAVSPPGGDMSEPVTAHTRRFVRAVWSLDRDLAYARHYPAVSWGESSSRDAEIVSTTDAEARGLALALLAEADRLQSVAELVGVATLPDNERLVLRTASLLVDGVLQQNALSANDGFCPPAKASALLRLALAVHDASLALLTRGVAFAALEAVDLSEAIRAREAVAPHDAAAIETIRIRVIDALEQAATS
jgi:V/A-type H+/Na+-transporting ATPase subunit A